MVQRLVALQAMPRWEANLAALRARSDALVSLGCAEGATLVVLPGLLGWALCAAELGADCDAPMSMGLLWRYDADALLPALATAGAGALHVYRDVARAFGVWLVAGCYPVLDDQMRLYQASAVISDQGQVVLEQRQTHRSSEDQMMGIAADGSLDVAETPAGTIGLVIGEDVHYPEVSRALSWLGAHILVHQGAWRHEKPAEQWCRLWREVQSNAVYGVEALVDGGGFVGPSRILAPLALSSHFDGVLSSTTRAGDDATATSCDLAALRAYRQKEPMGAMVNWRLTSRDLPALYGSSGQT